jgi:hypothetical protein
MNQNSIQLQWESSAESSFIRGYHVYRNNIRITSELLTDATYLDESLPNGNYEYYVRTYYKEGCVSDSSNHVEETIELGIKEFEDGITIYPNPTTGELIVEIAGDPESSSGRNDVWSIEVFDIYGRKVFEQKAEGGEQKAIDISELQAGIYFVRIETEKGVVVKKVIKY